MRRSIARAQLAVWTRRMNHRAAAVQRARDNHRPRSVIEARLQREKVAADKVHELQAWLHAHPRHRSQRELLADWCTWALAHEPDIHYAQIRPMRGIDRAVARQLPVTMDCSESTTAAYKAAGARDPNGLGYNGSGYTGTLRSNLRKISLIDARVGDLIVYGAGAGSHVVIVIKPGADPLVFSHGQEKGPFLIRHSAEVASHAGGFTCHDGGLA